MYAFCRTKIRDNMKEELKTLELAKVEERPRRGRPRKEDKMIPVPISMSKGLLNDIDDAANANRSNFVREACREKLEREK